MDGGIRNQDLGTRRVHCHEGVIASRLSQGDRAKKYMYKHTYLSVTMCTYIELNMSSY